MVEKRFCLEEVDSRSSLGREYFVVLCTPSALLLRMKKRTKITMAMITPTASIAAMTPPAMAPLFAPPLPETSSVVLPTHTRKPCGGPSEREEKDTYRHSSSGHRPVSVLGDNCRQNCNSCLYTCEQPPLLSKHSLKSTTVQSEKYGKMGHLSRS